MCLDHQPIRDANGKHANCGKCRRTRPGSSDMQEVSRTLEKPPAGGSPNSNPMIGLGGVFCVGCIAISFGGVSGGFDLKPLPSAKPVAAGDFAGQQGAVIQKFLDRGCGDGFDINGKPLPWSRSASRGYDRVL